jgi:hypothetical protein
MPISRQIASVQPFLTRPGSPVRCGVGGSCCCLTFSLSSSVLVLLLCRSDKAGFDSVQVFYAIGDICLFVTSVDQWIPRAGNLPNKDIKAKHGFQVARGGRGAVIPQVKRERFISRRSDRRTRRGGLLTPPASTHLAGIPRQQQHLGHQQAAPQAGGSRRLDRSTRSHVLQHSAPCIRSLSSMHSRVAHETAPFAKCRLTGGMSPYRNKETPRSAAKTGERSLAQPMRRKHTHTCMHAGARLPSLPWRPQWRGCMCVNGPRSGKSVWGWFVLRMSSVALS